MRLANLHGRATLVATETRGIDVATASAGRFGPGLSAVYDDWDEFVRWACAQDLTAATVSLDRAALGCPSPEPRQVFAIGLNYRDHAAEAGLGVPEGMPPVFTKFPTCLTGPDTEVVLPSGGHTDWEVELVVVIGRRAHHVSESDAWDHVAGLAVGQDISERIGQLAGPAPQFSFGKSHPGFGPVGPWLVTPDEVSDRDDLELGCSIDGDVVQKSRTSELVHPVGELVAALSAGPPLLPGDVVFTGTPAGVGLARRPPRYLQPGDTLTTWIEGIGELRQTFVPAHH
jgi:2-keto-4-pentenoate hydratase/2-oxohepta-3-ene-1,7-dioic acid hydratase in catechol pathway